MTLLILEQDRPNAFSQAVLPPVFSEQTSQLPILVSWSGSEGSEGTEGSEGSEGNERGNMISNDNVSNILN